MNKYFCILAMMFICVNVSFAQSTTIHNVQRGETLEQIAQKYGVSVEALKQANPNIEDFFYVGLRLNIPEKRDDVIQNPSSEVKREIIQQSSTNVDNEQEITVKSTDNQTITIPEPMKEKMAKEKNPKPNKSGYIRSNVAISTHLGLNVSYLTGKGIKDDSPGIGYSIGLSADFWNTSIVGMEIGLYYNRYEILWPKDTRMKMDYMEGVFMPNLKLVGQNSVLELNIGISLNAGLGGRMYYKGEKVKGAKIFGGENSDGLFKTTSYMFLYGLTYRYKDFFARMLLHNGLSNINYVGTDKIKLVNWEFSLGFNF